MHISDLCKISDILKSIDSFLQLITVKFAMVRAQLVTIAMVQLKKEAFFAMITTHIGKMLQGYA